MLPKPTNLPYWGKRNYLHSSQILSDLENLLPALKMDNCIRLNGKFRTFLHTQGEFFFIDTSSVSTPHAAFVLQDKDNKISIGLRPIQELVTDSIYDDENEIIQHGTTNTKDQTAVINDYNCNRFFAVLVALNKKLIYSILPVENDTAWILAQIDLETPFKHTKRTARIECRVASVIAERMVKTTIYVDGKSIGSTVFTKVDKP